MSALRSATKLLPASLWLRRASRQWRGGADLVAVRADLIRRFAPGKTFIDVGGMWAIHGRNAFAAEEAGATRVTLFDAMGPSEEFKATHGRVQSSIRFIHGDLHDTESVRAAGTSDVVWCTGVLYHTPHPLLLLHHLRQMTGQHLILGSRVIPEVPGLEQASVFYPGTGPAQRSVFADVHGAEAVAMAGAAAPFDETPDREYANYWWGITPSALLAMLRYAGFDVVEQYRYFPFSLEVVAAASTRPSLVPALNFKPLPYGLT